MFDYTIKADGSQALATSKQVEDSLHKVEGAAKDTGKAITGAFKGAELRDAQGRFLGTSVAAQQLRDRVMATASASEAFSARLRANSSRAEEVSRAMARLESIHAQNAARNQPLAQSFAGVAAALQREANLLEQIRGPARRHMEDVQALTSMYNRGAISAKEYLSALGAVDARGKGAKPESGGGVRATALEVTRSVGGTAGGMAADAVEGGLGALGKAGAIAAAIGAATALAGSLISLGDSFTELSNKAQKLVTTSTSVTGALFGNYSTSLLLQSSLKETVALSAKVKSGTDDLNMSSKQQQDLAKSLGTAVRAEGRALDEAGQLTEKLAFSMQRGVIDGEAMKTVLKDYPSLGASISQITGKSRNELLRMASEGKVTGEMMVDWINRSSDALQNKLGKQLETSGDKMQHFKDKVTLAFGALGQKVSSVAGTILDGLSSSMDAVTGYAAALARAHHAANFQLEIEEKIAANRERMVQTEGIQASMRRRGVDTGPVQFDAAFAEGAERLRMTLAEIGVNMPAVFTEAKSKAVIYQQKMEELSSQRAGEKMAEDIRKVWKEHNNINDVLDAQRKKLADLVEDVAEYRRAIADLAERRKLIAQGQGLQGSSVFADRTPSVFGPDLGMAGAETADERDAARGLEDKVTDLKVATGELSQVSADATKKLRDQSRGLQDINRDYKNGTINARQYKEALESLGLEKSRLQKIYEDIKNPAKEFRLDMAALDTLMKAGKITATEYRNEFNKLADAFAGEDVRKMLEFATKGMRGEDRGDASGMTTMDLIDDPDRIGTGRRKSQAEEFAERQARLEREYNLEKKMREELASKTTGLGSALGPNRRDYSGAIKFADIADEKKRWDRFAEEIKNFDLTKNFREDVGVLNKMLKEGTITVDEHAAALLRLGDAYTVAKGKAQSAGDGMRSGWARLRREILDINSLVADKMVNTFHTLEGALIDVITGIDVSWKKIANQILRDLTQIALRMLMMKALMALGGGPGGVVAMQGFAAASGGAHASGGSYVVGGAGGPDSQNVVFRLSPGERVDFTPPGETPRHNGGGSVEIHNHFDDRQILSPLQTNRGHRVLHNFVRKNPRMFGRR